MTDTSRLAAAIADRYAIERELGQGGMATVYLAHDLRHDRKVALKVLRPELAAILGGERFLKEIRTTANLQHPHILTLHDSGEAGGLIYYVMPYVEGESLRDRLNREKQLPVDEAVRIAKEVAGALDYAHRHGVVHRDIKPENILLHDGSATVADFGIALAASRSEGSTRMTETGMSLGTPAYMSPEQAMGEREITPKSDIYALGCVLYEMLTGEPPYTGPTAQAIIARVMTEQPRSVTMQRHTVPPHIDEAVHRALEKLPADRFASAADFARALDKGGSGDGGTAGWATRGQPHPAIPRSRYPTLLLALATFAAGALLAWFARGGGATAAQRLRLTISLPTESSPIALRVSPDGSTLAFAGAGTGDRTAIFTRRLDDLAVRRLEGTDGAFSISFSPDGQWIAYAVPGQALKVQVTGGTAVPIPIQGNPFISAIEFAGPDSYVIQLGNGSLATVEGGGAMKVFASTDSVIASWGLDQVMPDGKVLAQAWTRPPYGPVMVVDPASGRRVTLVEGAVAFASFSDGTLVWAMIDGTIFAAPYRLGASHLAGPAVPVGGQVFSVLGLAPPVSFVHGALVYTPMRQRSLMRVNRLGIATPLLATDRTYHSPRISPDGRRIAFDFTEQQRDVWLFDIADSTLTRFGFDSTAHDPMWLPDGRGLLFGGMRAGNVGIMRRPLDGSMRAEPVFFSGPQTTAHTVTPDGRIAIAARIGADGQFDLVQVHLDDQGRFDTLIATQFSEGFPALSPDGKWLAYASDESGRLEVYVRAFPGMGGKAQVSQDGGSEPVWSRDGREIFFRSSVAGEPKLVAAAVDLRGGFRVTGRQPLFSVASYESAQPHADYDVFPDGRSFVMVRQGRPGQLAEIVYIQGIPQLARGRRP